MEQTKYEQNISKISKEIIKKFSVHGIYHTTLAIELAKDSLQREAEAYVDGWHRAGKFESCKEQLQSLGLVP